ncbi:nitrosoguanidine resistance protein [Grosmannia clavigera kw1407]|uniref:Nitrosoguanidine resistance protein n=1 Tax=Grosmannia clavigera (strain kw1407 / UAMH 11150) TaxID=655863 RepID=F0XDY8_GROCL|nr:nitrosoguanidine resistance protein [Grosmannia clavigera kw1407]EFX03740.1 nitrosoguanidine resistance protein [Grosmannia clavigera kw1407]
MARTTPLSPQWWPTHRSAVFKAVIPASLLIGVLFLSVMSWFFGSSFDMRYRVHNLRVLMVDLDGGAIGAATQTAYNAAFIDRQFPTLEFASTADYPDAAAVQSAVCHGNYWGAVYSHSGATDRFRNAISSKASTAYDSSDAVSYVYSETHYAAISDSYVKSSLATLVGASRDFFYEQWNSNSSNVGLATMNLTDSAALMAYLDPFEATSVNLTPMSMGTHMYLNTVYMVLPILTQFFFLMALNGIFTGMGVFVNMAPSRIWMLRLVIAKVHALILSLVFTGVVWAFREDWDVTGLMFLRTWMVLWFYMEINFLVVESLIGSFIPLQFMAFFILSWVLMNVGSTIFPFELQPGFFRLSYLFPAHETYLLLVQIWSNGCHRRDYIALPIMFSWWVLGHLTTFLSTRKRVADALAEAPPPPPPTAKDSEEVTLSGDANTLSRKASVITRDPDNNSINHSTDDVETRANGNSDTAR